MNQDSKNPLRKAAEEAQVRLARSLLSWKYKKEGQPNPGDLRLEQEARKVAGDARKTIARSGKTIWKEFKSVYAGGTKEKEDPRE